MNTPAAKRRRVEAANSALLKPFRSPFKKAESDASPGPRDENEAPTTPSAKASGSSTHDFKTPAIPAALSSRNASITSLPKTPSLLGRSPRTSPKKSPKKGFSSPMSTASLLQHPHIGPLLKKQKAFEKQMRELKQELETVEQAKKIEVDSERKRPGQETDAELVELIGRWRGASRTAAEELFGGVSDRVNRMGGPAAFKEMQKRKLEDQMEFQRGFDEEPTKTTSDEEDAENYNGEKRDLYAEYDIDPETENEKAQREGNAAIEDDEPDDEFTMSMMLRSLNVDLKAIGYDREQQRWVD